jgi:hypothetical protein
MLREIAQAYGYAVTTPLALWCMGFFLTAGWIGSIAREGWSAFTISSGKRKGQIDITVLPIGLAGIGLMGYGVMRALSLVSMNALSILYALILAVATVGAVIGTLRFKPDYHINRNAFGLAVFAMGFGPLIDSLIEFRFPPEIGVGILVMLLVIIVNLGVGSYILWKNDALEHVTWAREQLRKSTTPSAGDTGAQDPP